MTASIIIPSYNSVKTIGSTLESIDFSHPALADVVVVDSSPIETFEKIQELSKGDEKVKFIHLDRKSIPAIARNAGVENARGELLIFIDSDAYADKNWFDLIIDAYHKGTKAGGGSIKVPGFQKKNLVAQSQYYLQFNEYLPVGDVRIKSFIPSCNFFCSRELFEEAGGFPEIRASEDVLFGKKISQSSPIWFHPGSAVFHIFGCEWSRLFSNQELLGKYVAIYRKEESTGFFYSPAVQILLMPFIPLIKYSLLLPRMIQTDWKLFGGFLYSTPGIFMGLISWTIGYMKGIFEKKRD